MTDCPECDRMVRNGSEHERDCLYAGYDANSIIEIGDSWDREAAYESWAGV